MSMAMTLKPLRDEPVQGLRVQEPLGGEAVHHDERDAPAADGEPDAVAVGQREGVAGEPGRPASTGGGRPVLGGRARDRARVTADMFTPVGRADGRHVSLDAGRRCRDDTGHEPRAPASSGGAARSDGLVAVVGPSGPDQRLDRVELQLVAEAA